MLFAGASQLLLTHHCHPAQPQLDLLQLPGLLAMDRLKCVPGFLKKKKLNKEKHSRQAKRSEKSAETSRLSLAGHLQSRAPVCKEHLVRNQLTQAYLLTGAGNKPQILFPAACSFQHVSQRLATAPRLLPSCLHCLTRVFSHL